uniref:Uncharacterized protein n=1 Tax=Cyanistes caeruleus TaxID=156563 RepID=A0A8C0ZKA3_CYACU
WGRGRGSLSLQVWGLFLLSAFPAYDSMQGWALPTSCSCDRQMSSAQKVPRDGDGDVVVLTPHRCPMGIWGLLPGLMVVGSPEDVSQVKQLLNTPWVPGMEIGLCPSLSAHRVVITITRTFCSHTMRQKSP